MTRRFLVALALASSLSAAPRWLRTVSAAAVCAASAFDAGTTAYGAAHGAREDNAFFLGSTGNVRWGRFALTRAATCGAAIAASRIHRLPDRMVLPLNGALVGTQTWAGAHNLQVLAATPR